MKRALLLPALILTLTSCGKTAQSTMQGFCSDLSKGQWQDAFKNFADAATFKAALTDLEKDQQTKQLVEGVFSHAKCTVTNAKDNNVTLEVDAVNARVVTGQVMAESMGLAFMSAFGGKDGEKMMQEAVMAKFVTALNDPNAPRTKTTVTVPMQKVGNTWVPQDGEKLLSALTGGLDQLGQ